jgi:hypothetical protein
MSSTVLDTGTLAMNKVEGATPSGTEFQSCLLLLTVSANWALPPPWSSSSSSFCWGDFLLLTNTCLVFRSHFNHHFLWGCLTLFLILARSLSYVFYNTLAYHFSFCKCCSAAVFPYKPKAGKIPVKGQRVNIFSSVGHQSLLQLFYSAIGTWKQPQTMHCQMSIACPNKTL